MSNFSDQNKEVSEKPLKTIEKRQEGFPSTKEGIFGTFFSYISVGFILAALGFLFYDSFHWLRSGSWHAVRFGDVIHWSFPKPMGLWLEHPESWTGLHKVVSLILVSPAFLVFFFMNIFFMIFRGK